MPIEDSINAQEATNLAERAKVLNNAHQALKSASIIPDVLDDFTPTARLQVLYPKDHTEVLLGNEITPPNSQDMPIVTATVGEDDGKGYVIVMTDPDAPSREDPKWSEFCHWIAPLPTTAVLPVQNHEEAAKRHGAPDEQRKVKSQVVEYMGPAPPPKTGKHRYVFVLLKGDAKDISKLKGPSEVRKNWNTDKPRHGVRQWAKEYGLEVVGANFFVAQNKEQ